ncbi:NYN domain-containing protein [Microcoleus sp. AT8-B1]|uniref:NYN domain-containing protein n=1 Tax=unclassified Microcoleus TaxID=2642155 RepID=UPI002FD768A6
MKKNHSAIGKETKQSQALVSIFCDLQNVLDLTQKQAELLVAFAKSKGRLDCLKAYYNSQYENQLLAKNQLEYLGFQGVDVPSHKNSADKQLIFDCIKRVAIKPSPEIIILVSGDRDFAGLISVMLELGKKVIVFAQRCRANKKLIKLVGDDNFHYIDELPSLFAGNTQNKADKLSA